MLSGIKHWLISAFGFSRSETNAFIILLPIMVLVIFSEPIYTNWIEKGNNSNIASDSIRVDSLIATMQWKVPKDSTPRINEPSIPLFAFDPNTATTSELQSLGLTEKLAKRIENFRNKGGKFRLRSDLSKIYGMDSIQYRKLYSYINLPEKKEPPLKFTTRKENSLARILPPPFDLNTADSIQLISIYGIGPKRAHTILTYRNKLGGFISFDQLKEIYGLDSTVISQLEKRVRIDPSFTPAKINVNTATEETLAAFPYVRFRLAKAIAAYRFQHGNFQTVEELIKITLLDGRTFEKIKPYLTVN